MLLLATLQDREEKAVAEKEASKAKMKHQKEAMKKQAQKDKEKVLTPVLFPVCVCALPFGCRSSTSCIFRLPCDCLVTACGCRPSKRQFKTCL